jgi:hypothetical protein
VGIFDEIDEGTAIFKQMHVSEVPSNVPYKKTSVPSSYNYTTDDEYYISWTGSTYWTSSTPQSSAQWSKTTTELAIRFQGIDDNLPTDWYLYLTGEAAKMLRGEVKMTPTIPSR